MNKNILILSLLVLFPSLAFASSNCCYNLGINFCEDSSVCYKTASDCECEKSHSTEYIIMNDIKNSKGEYSKNPDGYREKKINELTLRFPSLGELKDITIPYYVYTLLPDVKYRAKGASFTKCGTIATKQLSINANLDNFIFGEMSQYYKHPEGYREGLINRLVSRGADESKATAEVYKILKDFNKQ